MYFHNFLAVTFRFEYLNIERWKFYQNTPNDKYRKVLM